MDQIIIIPDPLLQYGFDGAEYGRRAHVWLFLCEVGLSRMTKLMEEAVDLETISEAGSC